MYSHHAFKKSSKGNEGRKQLFFQPKLTINPPDDQYEREADMVAESVVQTKSIDDETAFISPVISGIQRKCANCEEEEKLQRKESGNKIAETDESFEQYVGSLNNSGRSLPPESKSYFESKMGYDFSNVKVHTDHEAARSANAINALAYTSGNHIVFNQNQFQPETQSGKKLLAHELTHTIQQSHGIQQKQIQRAVFICDEYRSVSTTNYHPGPGIDLNLSGTDLTINANLEVYGSGASATVATQMKRTIESIWTQSFTGGYNVTARANIQVRGTTEDSNRTQINVISGEGVSNVMPSYWIVGSNYMNYYLNSSDINWTPAHEFGHLIGLGDRYSENWVAQIFGATRTSTPDTGWSGNLMAEVGGVLENKNIEEIVRRFFPTRSVCARGHYESPL